ncbi:glycosyltransferase family 2 protein [soil metagenome]
MKLSIVIPVFNEEKTIEILIKKVAAIDLSPMDKELIVVNDASRDKTSEKLLQLKKEIKDLQIFTHTANEGKGAAVRTGFEKATGEYIVIQDADLEYDPKQLVVLVKPIIQKKAEVVFGTRLKGLPHVHGEMSRSRFLLHYIGNRFLSLVTSLLYGQWITDMETCYKIFPKAALKKFTLSGNGFDFEPEITAKLVKVGYKIVELPIVTQPRGYNEGKKLQTIPDGIKALLTLFKYRFLD